MVNLALIIFSLGIMVGFHKAEFSYHWGENYDRLFGMPRDLGRNKIPDNPPRSVLGNLGGNEFSGGNSAVGSIIKFDSVSSTLYIKGDDNVEKNIVIDTRTLIRMGPKTIQPADLKTDDKVVILGVPSSTGQIEARFIRVFPPTTK